MNVSLKSYIILISILCFSLATAAQISQPRRFEKEKKGREEFFNVISLEERGIAILRETEDYNGMKRTWELILLDTALQQKATINFSIDSRYPLVGYETTRNELLVLYRMGEHNKNHLQLITFDLDSMNEKERFEIKPEVDFRLTHFVKVGSSVSLGGYVSNDPAILLYNLTDKSIKVVPGFFQKDNELVDLRVNQNQTFNVLLIDRSTRAERKLVFRTFDEQGKLLLEDIIPIDDQKALQSSLTSSLEREDLGVFGTWGERTGKQSFGFFAIPVDPFTDQKIKYYHFGELGNFLNYMSPKRANRIKENTKENLEDGRKPSFSTYVVPYRVEETKDGFVMLAEVYNPVTQPMYSTSPYANPYYTNPYGYYNPFFPGYYRGMRMYRPYYDNNVKTDTDVKTYETVLIAFDGKGDLLWDESVKLGEIEKPSVEQVGDFYTNDNSTVLLYKKESELKVKRVDKLSHEVQETSGKIRLMDDADEIRDETEGDDGVRHWIGNTFYVWGYESIRNESRKNDKTRHVFYINKVVVP